MGFVTLDKFNNKKKLKFCLQHNALNFKMNSFTAWEGGLASDFQTNFSQTHFQIKYFTRKLKNIFYF